MLARERVKQAVLGIAENKRKSRNTKADMDRAIALDPTNSMAFNNRGIAYLCTGDAQAMHREVSMR